MEHRHNDHHLMCGCLYSRHYPCIYDVTHVLGGWPTRARCKIHFLNLVKALFVNSLWWEVIEGQTGTLISFFRKEHSRKFMVQVLQCTDRSYWKDRGGTIQEKWSMTRICVRHLPFSGNLSWSSISNTWGGTLMLYPCIITTNCHPFLLHIRTVSLFIATNTHGQYCLALPSETSTTLT